MDSRWARLARGFAAAGFATFVAALSHTLAGGAAPTAFGVLASLLISAMACTVLTGRTLSLWRLAASVAISQVLFHWLFSGLGMPAPTAHHGMSPLPLEAPGAHDHAGSMWLAHTIAGLLTILAFRYAEAAFWGLADTARLFLARLVAVVVPVALGTRPAAIAVPVFLPRDLQLLLSPMRHRGPPAEFAA